MNKKSDFDYMQRALELARLAQVHDDVPVGAMIVQEGIVLAESFNTKEQEQLPTRHAEINAIEQAAKKLGHWRLLDCSLFVTLEPCLMCAGALVQARISRVVYAAPDPKGGGLGSLYEIHKDARLNHSFEVCKDICSDEASELLKNFFRNKRSANPVRQFKE